MGKRHRKKEQPGKKTVPSCIFFQNFNVFLLQKSKGEFIEGLKDMVCNLLRKYNHQRGAASTGKPPGIIIYRNFVDEDDLKEVNNFLVSIVNTFSYFLIFLDYGLGVERMRIQVTVSFQNIKEMR
jgi:hypothetical protein